MLGFKSTYAEYLEFNKNLNDYLSRLGNEALWLKRCSVDLVATLTARHVLCPISDNDSDETLLRLASVMEANSAGGMDRERPADQSSALVASGGEGDSDLTNTHVSVYNLARKIHHYILSQTDGQLANLLGGIYEPLDVVTTIRKTFKKRRRREVKQLFSETVDHVTRSRITRDKRTLALFVQHNLKRFRQLDVSLLDGCNALLGVDDIEDFEWLDESDSVDNFRSLFVPEEETRIEQRALPEIADVSMEIVEERPRTVPAQITAPTSAQSAPAPRGTPSSNASVTPTPSSAPAPAPVQQTDVTTRAPASTVTPTPAASQPAVPAAAQEASASPAPSEPITPASSTPVASSTSSPAAAPKPASTAPQATGTADPRPRPKTSDTTSTGAGASGARSSSTAASASASAAAPAAARTATTSAAASSATPGATPSARPPAPAETHFTISRNGVALTTPQVQSWDAKKAQDIRASHNAKQFAFQGQGQRPEPPKPASPAVLAKAQALRETIHAPPTSPAAASATPGKPPIWLPPPTSDSTNPPGTRELVAAVKVQKQRQRELGTEIGQLQKESNLKQQYRREYKELGDTIRATETYLRKVCNVGIYAPTKPRKDAAAKASQTLSSRPTTAPTTHSAPKPAPAASKAPAPVSSGRTVDPRPAPHSNGSVNADNRPSSNPSPEVGLSIASKPRPDTAPINEEESTEYSIAGSRNSTEGPSSLIRSRDGSVDEGRSPKRHQIHHIDHTPLHHPQSQPGTPNGDLDLITHARGEEIRGNREHDLVWGQDSPVSPRPMSRSPSRHSTRSPVAGVAHRFQPRANHGPPSRDRSLDRDQGRDDDYYSHHSGEDRGRELAMRLG